MSDDRSREILEERARTLALPLAGATRDASSVSMLSFTVGRERFALESRFVFAVFRLAELVPLPGARAPVVGVTRWRGDVLTVLDLRRVVGGSPGSLDDLGRVIVAGAASPELGILADSVDDIVWIDPTALHALPSERKVEQASSLRGVTSDAIHVLDAAALIARQTDGARASANPVPAPPPSQ